jgi:glucokinase
MPLLGIDLGGTKLAMALFSETGILLCRQAFTLDKRSGHEVGELIVKGINQFLDNPDYNVNAIGIAVPGIYSIHNGTVWAPNIPQWNEYPLLKEIQDAAGDVPVIIDSDRACYILGEQWSGNARGCKDAIYLSVGTGIGAGIMTDGKVLRGSHDIAGAIGWMALQFPYMNKYKACGCFEYYASGEGIGKLAQEKLIMETAYNGILRNKPSEEITAYDVFDAYDKKDSMAMEVIADCTIFWGMAIANLVSMFNPEKIILGGGIFGPAVNLIPAIRDEATKWAQPKSMLQVAIDLSALGGDAGVYGAAFLALQLIKSKTMTDVS